MAEDIDLTENGTLITFHYDGRNYRGLNPMRAMYRRQLSIIEEPPKSDNQEMIVFSDTGRVTFQNDEYFFIGTFVTNYQEASEIWGNVWARPDFPNLPSITHIRGNEDIIFWMAYSTDKTDIDLTYVHELVQPDGTRSREIRSHIERGLYNNNLVTRRLYRERIEAIERGDFPAGLLFRAGQTISYRFGERSLFGKYQLYVNIFDKDNLITTFVLEFYIIE
jgi:hypothetical protein